MSTLIHDMYEALKITSVSCGFNKVNTSSQKMVRRAIQLYETTRPNEHETEQYKYNNECMIRQERCTKGRIALELQHILAQYHYSDPAAYAAIEDYKDKLLKDSYNG